MRTRTLLVPVLTALCLAVVQPAGAAPGGGPVGPDTVRRPHAAPHMTVADVGDPALSAYVDAITWAELPDSATANAADAELNGLRSWYVSLTNESAATITSPVVQVDSGHDPGMFSWAGPIAAFPVAKDQPALAPGEDMPENPWITSGVQASFAAGFDSTRTVDSSTIPPGGSEQVVTVTVTPQDPRYETMWGSFLIEMFTQQPGVSVVSTTQPANLDAGETVDAATGSGSWLYSWYLAGERPHVGKTYTFTATVRVENGWSTPIEFRPQVSIEGALGTDLRASQGSETTIPVPSLDGSEAGRGSVRFAVAEAAQGWTGFIDEGAAVDYAGTPPVIATQIRVAKVGYGNKLFVDVDPNLGSGSWNFRVQKQTSTGAWRTLPTVYQTFGAAETRTLTLGAGTFRVVVPAQNGYLRSTSAAVRLTAPTLKVAVAKAGYGNKLYVDVDPNRASGYWTFRVQKRSSTGVWRTLPTVYRTYGTAETRTLTLGPGTFRVRVAGKDGYLGATSAAVRLTSPTVRVALTTDAAQDLLRVNVDPNRGADYWTFQVQTQTAAGWTTLAPVYRTEGTSETRSVNLGAGRYRVKVAPKYGYLGATSVAVTLTR